METLSGVDIKNLSAEQLQLALYGVAAVGLLYCFAGYKLFRLVLALTGFMIAGSVAGALAGFFSTGDAMVMLVCGVLGGICGAMALTFIYKLGVFGLGCIAAVLVSQEVSTEFFDAPGWFTVLGAGCLGGLFALLMERPAMTLATAAIGAWLSALVAYIKLSGVTPEKLDELGESLGAASPNVLWLFLGWFALSIVGATVQFSLGNKRKAA